MMVCHVDAADYITELLYLEEEHLIVVRVVPVLVRVLLKLSWGNVAQYDNLN